MQHLPDRTQASQPALAQLAAIDCDLELADHQRDAWDLYVRTLAALANVLRSVEKELLSRASDQLPTLPHALRLRASRLTAELEAVRIAQAATGVLYQSLTAPQRVRADRIFPRLCQAFGWDAHPMR